MTLNKVIWITYILLLHLHQTERRVSAYAVRITGMLRIS